LLRNLFGVVAHYFWKNLAGQGLYVQGTAAVDAGRPRRERARGVVDPRGAPKTIVGRSVLAGRRRISRWARQPGSSRRPRSTRRRGRRLFWIVLPSIQTVAA
jgi:hypothetical protein